MNLSPQFRCRVLPDVQEELIVAPGNEQTDKVITINGKNLATCLYHLLLLYTYATQWNPQTLKREHLRSLDT